MAKQDSNAIRGSYSLISTAHVRALAKDAATPMRQIAYPAWNYGFSHLSKETQQIKTGVTRYSL
ncbi:hypothetical protein GCM10011507_11890 [Edaphobacter acidisoli]|uniref:Uncharacterized protein n=1 Tax=Edaphobacter acidisoli TaxID=2040573 RepID=A0A916W2E3_9BACT|nr:hypothetical protein GCM10011507_11890 [Edaphobacter acidisoli]